VRNIISTFQSKVIPAVKRKSLGLERSRENNARSVRDHVGFGLLGTLPVRVQTYVQWCMVFIKLPVNVL
jgi:hypothetical protein